MILPHNVLLNICRYIQSRDDMYSFLEYFGMEDQYYKICKYVADYYIEELLPDEPELDTFLDTENFPEGVYPDELFPIIDTDSYTVFCSQMVKEYI